MDLYAHGRAGIDTNQAVSIPLIFLMQCSRNWWVTIGADIVNARR